MSDQPEPAAPPSTALAKRLKVVVATPKRSYHGIEDLPAGIARALSELALRGTPCPTNAEQHAAWTKFQTADPAADQAFRAQANKYQFEFLVAIGGMSRARNTCVGEFLKDQDNVFLIWQDDDLERADGYTGLAEVWLRLLSHRQPITGAIYCTRKPRPHWAVSFMPAAEFQPDGDGLLQVAELAGGLKCIHRKVFTEVARIFGVNEKNKQAGINYRDRDTGETLTGFYQNAVIDHDLLSEDYFLDYLCRCAGIPIYADIAIKARHVEADGTTYPPGDFPPIPGVDDQEDANPELSQGAIEAEDQALK